MGSWVNGGGRGAVAGIACAPRTEAPGALSGRHADIPRAERSQPGRLAALESQSRPAFRCASGPAAAGSALAAPEPGRVPADRRRPADADRERAERSLTQLPRRDPRA